MFTTKSEVKYKDSVPYRPGMLSCGILWIKREELISAFNCKKHHSRILKSRHFF